MWSNKYLNRKCNEFVKEKDHNEHLHRIILSKPLITNSEPFKPSIFALKPKSHFSMTFSDRVRNRDNKTLASKLEKISVAHSIFHPVKIKIKRCPAFQSTGYKEKIVSKSLDKVNKNLYNRVNSVRTLYPIQKFKKDYEKNAYLECKISENKDCRNPCLKFNTPAQFMIKIGNILQNSNFNENNTLDDKSRPLSNFSKKVLRLNNKLNLRPLTSNKNTTQSTFSTLNHHSPLDSNNLRFSLNIIRQMNYNTQKQKDSYLSKF